MTPNEFLELAGEWCTGSREGEWRSAVSRAYFAAFHAGRLLLYQNGFTVPRGDQAHSYLWLRLANTGRTEIDQAGRDMNSLRRVRNRADYEWDTPFPHTLAVAQVLVADRIVEALADLTATPVVLAQVLSAIQVYERDVLGEITWHP